MYIYMFALVIIENSWNGKTIIEKHTLCKTSEKKTRNRSTNSIVLDMEKQWILDQIQTE